MSQFQASLAERFSTISDVANLSRTATPFSKFVNSDLSAILARPRIDLGQFGTPPAGQPPAATPPTPTPLTPGDANIYIGTVAQTPEQILTAAVHAARVAFEAVPTAQNGEVIDAAIPNGMRSAMITLLALAEATIQQLMQPQRQVAPPAGQPTPPNPTPVHPPPVFQPPQVFQPPFQIDPGVIHINPAVLAAATQPAVNPAPDATTAPAAGGDVAAASAPPSLPAIDIGGQLFAPQTVTHPETGATTTVFAPISAAGATNLSPVAGGGFHLTLDNLAASTLTGGAAAPAMTAMTVNPIGIG